MKLKPELYELLSKYMQVVELDEANALAVEKQEGYWLWPRQPKTHRAVLVSPELLAMLAFEIKSQQSEGDTNERI